jgi:hypothetical protein
MVELVVVVLVDLKQEWELLELLTLVQVAVAAAITHRWLAVLAVLA